MTASKRRKRNLPRQLTWLEIPETLERVGKAWELFCQRQSFRQIAAVTGVSPTQAFEDVGRMREHLLAARLVDADSALREALEVRAAVQREAWETLFEIKKARGEIISHSVGSKGEATSYMSRPGSGKAEADLIRTILQNEKEMEELLGLRKQQKSLEGDTYNDNRVLVVVGADGKIHELRPPQTG